MANNVCHFEIPADDIKSLEGFYADLFGWSFEETPGEIEYHIIKTPEGNLGGGIMKRMDPHQGPVNYICVESIDDALKKAADRGAEILVQKSPVAKMGWYAVLLDPQKNPLGMFQEDTNAA
jgi:uncharacterized protein